jgi:undecaprenyl phosphate N,N'-diacetylbacillosamine 1-phosphate transferase
MVDGNFYVRIVKPLIDWLIAFLLIIILSPLLMLLVIILAISFQGKPFFIQNRVGWNEKFFWILKFRSMKDIEEESQTDESRLNLIGRFIRKTSLDELPQLINVLRGEMSLVGPRPLLVAYLPYYNDEERARHQVRPGITGLAQVNGRNRSDWGSKLKYDIQYVNKISIWLDVRVLLKTIPELIKFKKTHFPENKVITFMEYASKR